MGLFNWIFGQKQVFGVEGTFVGRYPVDGYGFSEEDLRNALINKIQVDNGWKIATFRFTGSYKQ